MEENTDETMSNEQAFSMEKESQEDVFQFDEDKTQKGTSTQEDTSASPVGTEEDSEQKVPYSRFKRKTEEAATKIRFLEEKLEEFSKSKTQTENETPAMPPEWIELYGNSDASAKAWNVQVKLDIKREEASIERMLSMAQRQEEEAQDALVQNEEIIDDTLMELQEKRGIKLTPKMEDAILDIVDEFSPTGSDGKYISLFPFDKALEIYELRQGSKVRSTQNARTQVANLTGNSNAGDISDGAISQKRGWDAWREAL